MVDNKENYKFGLGVEGLRFNTQLGLCCPQARLLPQEHSSKIHEWVKSWYVDFYPLFIFTACISGLQLQMPFSIPLNLQSRILKEWYDLLLLPFVTIHKCHNITSLRKSLPSIYCKTCFSSLLLNKLPIPDFY